MANKSNNKDEQKNNSHVSYLPAFIPTVSTANVLKVAVVICLIYILIKMLCKGNKSVALNMSPYNTSSAVSMPIIESNR